MSNLALTATLAYSHSKENNRLLQLVIADAVNKDDDLARRLVRTLALDCNLPVRSVQKHILAQIQAGELVGIQDATGGGRWYTFCIPIYPGEEGYDPQECDALDHYCNGYHTPLDVSRHALYTQKALAAHKRDLHVPTRRPRTTIPRVIPSVDNSPTYPHRASVETRDRASVETQGASVETQGASVETQGASVETIPPHPPISRPISDPGITQKDLGASAHTKQKRTREQIIAARDAARRREEERLYGRREPEPGQKGGPR